jgi:phospholipid/cholesterol/gamma-HCH transport system permease protein
MGAVTFIQTSYNLTNPLISNSIIGTIIRDMTILELAPTITAIVFAGKIGSNIAAELGTMKIKEQIDALEVMGINSISYLVLPKIISTILMYPLLVIISGFLAIYGAFVVGTATNLISPENYIYGIRINFNPYTINFAIYKSLTFAFLISSISSYQGYYTKGGALEVGRSSTKAVTYSYIAILITDYLLAQILLN